MSPLTLRLVPAFVVAAAVAGGGERAARRYGKPLAGLAPTSVEALYAAPERFVRPVRVEAEVVEVCQVKGCWLGLKQGERTLRVTLDGFTVPAALAGRKVAVEGKVVATPPRTDELRVMPEDGAGEFRPPAELVASGLELRDR